MSWRKAALLGMFIATAIRRHIDPSKTTLAEIDMDLIFVSMMIVSSIEDLRR